MRGRSRLSSFAFDMLERPVFAFLDVPVAGAYHLIDPLIVVLTPTLHGAAFVVAVVVFTCTVRLLLHPLARAAARGERARAVLAPQIAELRKRHPDDPQRLQREVRKLQQESGISLFAGCMPLLLQAPFFTIMYRLCTSVTVGGHPNSLLTGAVLGVHANQHVLAAGLPGLVLLALIAAVSTLSLRWQPSSAGALRYLAYLPVLFATFLPLAGGVYLVTSTTWTVLERRLLRRDPAALVPRQAVE